MQKYTKKVSEELGLECAEFIHNLVKPMHEGGEVFNQLVLGPRACDKITELYLKIEGDDGD